MLFKRLIRSDKVQVAAIFIAVAVAATWRILLSPGTIGHRLDWSIPGSPAALANMLSFPFYIWNEQFLGYDMMTEASAAPAYFFYGLMGNIGVGGAFLSKALLFGVVFTSGYAMYFLAKHFTEGEAMGGKRLSEPALFAAAFYALSPVAFNQIVGGAQYYLIAYALAPAVFFFT